MIMMNLDLLNSIQEKITDIKKEIEQNNTREETQITTKLNSTEEYAIDRIEGDNVVLENRKTNEIKNVKKDMLPKNIKEGSIVQYINGQYIYNQELTQKAREEIKEKMDKLWN